MSSKRADECPPKPRKNTFQAFPKQILTCRPGRDEVGVCSHCSNSCPTLAQFLTTGSTSIKPEQFRKDASFSLSWGTLCRGRFHVVPRLVVARLESVAASKDSYKSERGVSTTRKKGMHSKNRVRRESL